MPSLIATLGLNMAGFRTGLNSAVTQASAAGQRIASSLGRAAQSQLAGFLGASGVAYFVKNTIQYGSHISDLSERIGISTDALQAWDYALKQTGATIDDGVKFFERLAVARDDAIRGEKTYVDAFKQLGISIDDLKTKRLEELGKQIAEIFQAGDAQQLIGALRDVGGRGASALATAFKEGLPQLVGAAKEAGVIIDKEVISKLDELGDRWEYMRMRATAGAAPVLTWLVKAASLNWENMQRAVTGVFGVLRFGPKAGLEMAAEERQQAISQEEFLRQRRDERAAARAAAAGGSSAGGGESGKVSERDRLEMQLFNARHKNQLDALSKEEKINELFRRRKELAEWAAKHWAELSAENRLRVQVDLEELFGQEEQLKRLAATTKSAADDSLMQYSRTAAQRIGAYAAADPVKAAQLETQKKIEANTRETNESVKRLSERASGGVQY